MCTTSRVSRSKWAQRKQLTFPSQGSLPLNAEDGEKAEGLPGLLSIHFKPQTSSPLLKLPKILMVSFSTSDWKIILFHKMLQIILKSSLFLYTPQYSFTSVWSECSGGLPCLCISSRCPFLHLVYSRYSTFLVADSLTQFQWDLQIQYELYDFSVPLSSKPAVLTPTSIFFWREIISINYLEPIVF